MEILVKFSKKYLQEVCYTIHATVWYGTYHTMPVNPASVLFFVMVSSFEFSCKKTRRPFLEFMSVKMITSSTELQFE